MQRPLGIKPILLLLAFIVAACVGYAQNGNSNLFPICVDGKFGFIDNTGKIVLEPQFNNANGFSEGTACIEKDGKQGFINEKGEIIIQPQYHYAGDFIEGLAPIIMYEKYGYINKDGEFVIPPDYDIACSFSEGLAYTSDGYIDKTGKVVIENLPEEHYYYRNPFSEGLALARVKSNENSNIKKTGFINKKGEFAIPPQYDNASDFSEGLACICIDNKCGYINKTGEIAIEPQFDDATDFSEKLAAVIIDKRLYYIDTLGNIVIETPLDNYHSNGCGKAFGGLLRSFHDGRAAVYVNGLWGFIDRTGKFVIEPQYQSVYDFSEGLACVQNDSPYTGFINSSGEMVIEPKFKQSWNFKEGLAAALDTATGKWGFIDKTGEYVIAPQFDEPDYFSDGLAVIRTRMKKFFIDKKGNIVISPQPKIDHISQNHFQEGLCPFYITVNEERDSTYTYNGKEIRRISSISYLKYGYLDKKGNIAINPEFDYAINFSEGLAGVCINEKYGFIDKTGKIVIAPEFDYVCDFSEGLARVKIGEKYSFIDKSGKIVIEPKFDFASDLSEGLIYFETDKKKGFVNKGGKKVIDLRFDKARSFSNGLAAFETGGKWGFINKKGEIAIEAKYDKAKDFDNELTAVYMEDNNTYYYIDKQGNLIWEGDLSFLF